MPKTILYLGREGSNSHLAASKLKKAGDIMMGHNSLEEIFSLVAGNENLTAAIPLENSISGSVNQAFDLLRKQKVSVIGEIILKINHCLVAKKNKALSSFNFCLSHPEIFQQCSHFLKKHRYLTQILVSDSATAAKKLLKNNDNFCALTSKNAAGLYGLAIINDQVENNPTNFTRFIVINKKGNSKGNKVSLIFSLVHQPGSLTKALRPFADNRLNLTKIESRPIIGKPWEYLFFADLDIGENYQGLTDSLKKMKKRTEFIKFLGVYDKGTVTYD